MKIALPISSFLPSLGGAEIGLHNIAMFLLDKGHEPTVITSYKHYIMLKKTKCNIPYKIIPYPPKFLSIYTNFPRIGNIMLMKFYDYIQNKYKFHFWHATFGYPIGVSVIEFCKKNKLPHLVRCVGEDIQIDKKINYGMRINEKINSKVRKFLPQAQFLVAITETVFDEYKKLNVDKSKILKIPNGVNLKYLQNFKKTSDIRNKLNIKSNIFLFLAFGRYHVKKNFIQLILAANNLKRNKIRNFSILIAGSGVSQLSNFIEDYDVKDVTFLYDTSNSKCINPFSQNKLLELPSNEILKIYQSCDCFVMPSLIETFGVVTIEAMAFGLPVIIANSPGNRDVSRNGKDALIYDSDKKAYNLSKKMMDLLGDKMLQKKYKEKSLKRVKSFDWSKIVDKYIDLYNTTLNNLKM